MSQPQVEIDWDYDHTTVYRDINIADFEIPAIPGLQNAWGFFVGGHRDGRAQRQKGRFALRMCLGPGDGCFVREDNFYHVPKELRHLVKSKVEVVEVSAGPEMYELSVIGESPFPFRMWSVQDQGYKFFNMKALVVQDITPHRPPKEKLDVYIGIDKFSGFHPFTRLVRPGFDGEYMFVAVVKAIDDQGDEDFLPIDVGAWTRATKDQPELRLPDNPGPSYLRWHLQHVHEERRKAHAQRNLHSTEPSPAGSEYGSADEAEG